MKMHQNNDINNRNWGAFHFSVTSFHYGVHNRPYYKTCSKNETRLRTGLTILIEGDGMESVARITSTGNMSSH